MVKNGIFFVFDPRDLYYNWSWIGLTRAQLFGVVEWRGPMSFIREQDKIEWKKKDRKERDKDEKRQKKAFYTILPFLYLKK